MTAHHLYGETYATEQGFMTHWRNQADRRTWWVCVSEPLVGVPMCKCVMDDYGDLVRVSEVV